MQREGEDETGLYKGKVGVGVDRAVLMQVEGMRRTVLEQVLVFVGRSVLVKVMGAEKAVLVLVVAWVSVWWILGCF